MNTTAVVTVHIKGKPPTDFAIHVNNHDSLDFMVRDALIAARAEHHEQHRQRIQFNAELRRNYLLYPDWMGKEYVHVGPRIEEQQR